MDELKQKIRNISDFPQKGIIFRDITPLLEDKNSFRKVVEEIANRYRREQIDKVVGIDARGFLIASAVAYKLKAGLIMVRKKGKLPYKTISEEYDLEYGKATLEIHWDSIKINERVLIIDDVLATGGTMKAVVKLVEKLRGKIIGIAFLIILDYLCGREALKHYPLFSLINYEN